MIPASRYSICDYCKKKSCNGCVLPYEDKEFGELIADGEDKVEIELYWRKNEKQIEQLFEDVKESGNKDAKAKAKAETCLQDCFRLFSEPEKLAEDNAWYCPKCKDFVLATKQMQIYKAPKILILCLKRFRRKEYFQEKFNILVEFPVTDLDISEYVMNTDLPEEYFVEKMDVEGKNSVHYDLFGVVNHFGGTGGGHYTAYAQNPLNKEWYDFDDSHVSKVRSPDDIIRESAYILFYRRRQ